MSGDRHRLPVRMPLPKLPPRTHDAPAHPARRNGPNASAPRMHPVGPRKQGFLHMVGVRARDSGNKIAASAHGMGSGGLAVDSMAIGCLGVERRVERFFILSHFFRM